MYMSVLWYHHQIEGVSCEDPEQVCYEEVLDYRVVQDHLFHHLQEKRKDHFLSNCQFYHFLSDNFSIFQNLNLRATHLQCGRLTTTPQLQLCCPLEIRLEKTGINRKVSFNGVLIKVVVAIGKINIKTNFFFAFFSFQASKQISK